MADSIVELLVDTDVMEKSEEVTVVDTSSPENQPKIENISSESPAGETLLSSIDGENACPALAVVTSEIKEVTQEDNIQQPPPKPATRIKRSFTTQFKLDCVEHAERTKNKTETARVFNVNRRRVQEWCMQKEKLLAIPKQQKRLSGGGRRQATLDVPSDAQKASDSIRNEIFEGVSNPALLAMARTALKLETPPESEFSKAKALLEATHIHPVPNITLTDASIIDTIVRNLSADPVVRNLSADPSVLLSASVLKAIQDLTSEASSQETKTSAIHDTSIEALMQKGTDKALGETPMDVSMGDGASIDSSQATQTTSGLEGIIPDDRAVSSQQDAIIQESNLGTESLNTMSVEGTPVGVAVENIKSTLGTAVQGTDGTSVQDPSVVQGNPLDVTVQAAMLDILMQIASSASSMQSSLGGSSQSESMETSLSVTTDEPPSITVPAHTNDNVVTVMTDKMPLSSPIEVSTTPRSKVKKVYSVEFKLECVAHAESTSKCAAARQFNVDRRRVQDWCSQKEKLKELLSNQKKQAQGGGRRPIDIDVEKQLATWIKQQQEVGERLNRKMVGDKAVQLYQEKGSPGFSASSGWVAKFMIRNGISLVSSTVSSTPVMETVDVVSENSTPSTP